MTRQIRGAEGWHRRARRQLALLASALVAYVGVAYELWLLVLVVVAGWVRTVMIVRVHRRKELPCQIARVALDDRWQSEDWRGEDLIADAITAIAGGSPALIRHARRMVERDLADLGRRRVALDRLDAVYPILRQQQLRRRRQRLRAAAVHIPVAAAVGVFLLVALSSHTPGPVVDHPWSSTIAVIAAAATAYLMNTERVTPS